MVAIITSCHKRNSLSLIRIFLFLECRVVCTFQAFSKPLPSFFDSVEINCSLDGPLGEMPLWMELKHFFLLMEKSILKRERSLELVPQNGGAGQIWLEHGVWERAQCHLTKPFWYAIHTSLMRIELNNTRILSKKCHDTTFGLKLLLVDYSLINDLSCDHEQCE